VLGHYDLFNREKWATEKQKVTKILLSKGYNIFPNKHYTRTFETVIHIQSF